MRAAEKLVQDAEGVSRTTQVSFKSAARHHMVKECEGDLAQEVVWKKVKRDDARSP